MPSSEDSRVPLAPGATLNNGSLTITGAPLGIGGFGITYAATNLLGQKRAVKELFPIGTLRQGGKLLPDPSATQTSWTQEKLDAARAGFLDEGKRLAELEHQGIVKVSGAFRDNDTIYLEMEFLEGETLWSFARRQSLSRAASLSIVKEAGEALSYLHGTGMVHRDVTPNNIMVCKDGRIVLIDLGAARQFIPNRTAHYTAIGTEGFAAPEQGLSQTRIGPYTDVYGLAAVTFWLLDEDNTPPPSCDHRLKVLHAGDPDPLPNRDAALTKALALKASERTQTIEAFLEAIGAKVKPQPEPKPKSEPRPASASPSSLGRRALIGTGVVGLLGVGVGIGKLFGGSSGSGGNAAPPTPEPTASPSPEPPRATPEPTPSPTPIPTPRPTPKPRVGLTVEEARALPPTYPAPKTLAEYKAQMVSIPGGTFEMGRNSGIDDEKPVHHVTLSPFGMGRTPVTVAMWREYAKAKLNGKMPELPSFAVWNGGWDSVLDHPIVNVSWTDCKAYADWASTQLGITIELPTEAQWEYASRGGLSGGGLSGTDYPWDDAMDDNKLWCSVKTYADSKTFRDGTAPVSRSNHVYVNGYGLLDMSGNVWQWCLDWYGAYGSSSATDPTGVSTGKERVRRGGSWFVSYVVYGLRCAYRVRNVPGDRDSGLGFRLSAPLPAP